jgi:hypothetical protein
MAFTLRPAGWGLACLASTALACGQPTTLDGRRDQVGNAQVQQVLDRDLRVTARFESVEVNAGYDVVGNPPRLRVILSATNLSAIPIEACTGVLYNRRWRLRAYATSERTPPPVWRSEDDTMGSRDASLDLSIAPWATHTDTLVTVHDVGTILGSAPGRTRYFTAILTLRRPCESDVKLVSPELPIGEVVVPPPGGGAGGMR